MPGGPLPWDAHASLHGVLPGALELLVPPPENPDGWLFVYCCVMSIVYRGIL